MCDSDMLKEILQTTSDCTFLIKKKENMVLTKELSIEIIEIIVKLL